MGDILDIEMWKFSLYDLEQTQIKIHQKNQFESKLQRMSVVVEEKDKYFVFCKGSPEKIFEMANKDSIPQNYNEVLEK